MSAMAQVHLKEGGLDLDGDELQCYTSWRYNPVKEGRYGKWNNASAYARGL